MNAPLPVRVTNGRQKGIYRPFPPPGGKVVYSPDYAPHYSVFRATMEKWLREGKAREIKLIGNRQSAETARKGDWRSTRCSGPPVRS
jgi:hypothetical protein